MKKVVCAVDNHMTLELGKAYDVIMEMGSDYYQIKMSSNRPGYNFNIWEKELFIPLEESRNLKIQEILK